MTTTTQGSGDSRPLRFGIMCTGHRFAAWEAACIRALLAVQGVEAALLIVDDSPAKRPGRWERIGAKLDPRTLLWRLYQRLVLNPRSRSTQSVDLSAELAGVPLLRCRPRQSGRWVQRLEPTDVDAIRAHDLDFVMRFAFNILRGDVLECARHGIWSFHHDDPDQYRGQPPGFWEIYRGDPVTGTVLQRLTERLDAGIILHKGFFRTIARSYPEARDQIFFGAADWPARLAREIRAGVETSLTAAPLPGGAPIYRAPNSVQMLRFLWLWGKAVLAHHYASIFAVQQWGVGIIDAPIEEVAGLTGTADPARFVRTTRWLPEPPGRFLADPFAVVTDAGELVILAEDYDWKQERGRIVMLREPVDGKISQPELVIDREWHLSYPHLLRLDDGVYCIPEMNEARRVELYRASADLQSWTLAATLLDNERVVDPTVFRHDGRWWMLGTLAEHDANLKLFGWYADELGGPWTPHLANPLKTDIRSSRPAGQLFSYADALYRPAQDCSTGYGAAVVVNRITRLTPSTFAEEQVSRIAPDRFGRYPSGLHTLSGAGGRTVLDGSRPAVQRAAAWQSIRRKTGRLAGRRR